MVTRHNCQNVDACCVHAADKAANTFNGHLRQIVLKPAGQCAHRCGCFARLLQRFRHLPHRCLRLPWQCSKRPEGLSAVK